MYLGAQARRVLLASPLLGNCCNSSLFTILAGTQTPRHAMISIKQTLPTSLSRQLTIGLVLVLGWPTLAVSASDEQIVGELMELSGLSQQIPRLPNEYLTLVDQLLVGLERQRHTMPKNLRRQIRQSFVDALTPEHLESKIRSRLLDGLSQDTILTTVSWLRSDLGKKITTAELNASSAEKSVQLTTFLLQLQLERPAPERLQLVRRIEEIIQGSEMATEAWEAIVAAVARALEGENRTRNLQNKEILEEHMASMRGSVKTMFQQGRIFEVLFTYRTLTDEELKQYAEFLETPVGRDITKIMNRAVHGVAIDAIQNIQPALFRKPQSPADSA